MPIIRISSLPLPDTLDMQRVMQALSSGVSRDVRIEQAQLSVSWQYIQENHYIAKGELADKQPSHTHPILVELLVPEVLSKDLTEKIMHSLAHRLGKELNFPVSNIFIYERKLISSQVFENGMLANWA
ncbi:MAG: hypothetical protein ACI978_002863 [Oleispira sp.]|jgi:hypothetical protein